MLTPKCVVTLPKKKGTIWWIPNHYKACVRTYTNYIWILKKSEFEFDKWMIHAHNREYWGKLVEEKVNLPENSYYQKNSKHQTAELKTCDTI